MEQPEILEALRKHLEEIIDSPGTTLEPDTPLLEWGILNSLTTTRLVAFVRDSLEVDIPPEEMVGEHFRDLLSISRLVAGLADRRDLPVKGA